METILKCAAVCIPAAFIAVSIKKDSPALSLAIITAAAFFSVAAASGALKGLADSLTELAETAGAQPAALAAVLKTLGISIIARLTSDVLKDAGMTSAASAAELCGAAAGVLVTLPVIKSILEMIRGLL